VKEYVMKTTGISFLMVILFCFSVYAYDDAHPPYLFKNEPFRSIPAKELLNKDIPEGIKQEIGAESLNFEVYQTNLIGNGNQDFVAIVHPGASPLIDEIHVYLKKPRSGYREISFSEDPSANIKDVVDIKHNGKWEVILADLFLSGKHSYMAYSIYEFKNYRLVNADRKYKGFPKFIWFTDKKNDKNAIQLTPKERQRDVEDKNKAIEYREVQ